MTIAERLKEERERLGLSQSAFGQLGGVGRTTVVAWEGATAFPNAAFLEAVAEVGLDVGYVVTGARDYEPPPALSSEERELLDLYRSAPVAVRHAALGALLGRSQRSPAKQVFHGPVGQRISGGSLSGGTNNFTVNMGDQVAPKKRK